MTTGIKEFIDIYDSNLSRFTFFLQCLKNNLSTINMILSIMKKNIDSAENYFVINAEYFGKTQAFFYKVNRLKKRSAKIRL